MIQAEMVALSSAVVGVLLVTCAVCHRLTVQKVKQHLVRRGHFLKRAVFLDYIGVSEFTLAFMMIIDSIFRMQFFADDGENARPVFQFFSFVKEHTTRVLVVVVILSIVRCLTQRLALGDLSKADVVSMSRVYVAPFTFLVAGLSACSWLRLTRACAEPMSYYEEEEQDEQIANFPHASHVVCLVYLVVCVFLFMFYDFVDRQRQGQAMTVRQFEAVACPGENGVFEDGTALMLLIVADSPTKLLPHFSIKTQKEAPVEQRKSAEDCRSDSKSNLFPFLNSENSASYVNRHQPCAVTSPQLASEITSEVRPTSPDKRPAMNYGGLESFLRQYMRLYACLVVYFVVLLGMYEYIEYACIRSAFGDHCAVVFAISVTIVGLLRIVQIKEAESYHQRSLVVWKTVHADTFVI